MQRGEAETLGGGFAERRTRVERRECRGGGNGALQRVERGVDHHVADEFYPRRRHPLGDEVRLALLLGDEMQVGQLVDDEPVQLLRHLTVERAQARLDMGDRDTQIGRGQRGGDRGVDVADDDQQVRPVLHEQRMQRQHDLGDLLGGRAGADLQVHVRRGDAQLLEEHAIHEKVIMLACMNEARRERSPRPQRPHDRRDLHEIGTRADDEVDAVGFERSSRSHRRLISR